MIKVKNAHKEAREGIYILKKNINWNSFEDSLAATQKPLIEMANKIHYFTLRLSFLINPPHNLFVCANFNDFHIKRFM